MLAIDSMNSNISANLLRWLILSGREHYFIFPVSFPESSSSTPSSTTLLRSSFFFCRHHLDWISLRHSVLTKSSVLRLALASMRTGQPEAGHPRNLYRVGRASSSSAQATGWRHDGWRARPARLHGSRSRSVSTRWNQARRSAGGGSGLFEVPGRYARFYTYRKSISHLSPGPRRFVHAFGKCKGGRLSPKQVLTAHLI